MSRPRTPSITAATGFGGAGDPGGPVFLNDYLVAVTSYGYTDSCRYLGGYQHVEIPVVQEWLSSANALCALDAANTVCRSRCCSRGECGVERMTDLCRAVRITDLLSRDQGRVGFPVRSCRQQEVDPEDPADAAQSGTSGGGW
jgi:hypothetical protein